MRELLKYMMEEEFFTMILVHMYVVKFQKEGFYMLMWSSYSILDKGNFFRSSENADNVFSA